MATLSASTSACSSLITLPTASRRLMLLSSAIGVLLRQRSWRNTDDLTSPDGRPRKSVSLGVDLHHFYRLDRGPVGPSHRGVPPGGVRSPRATTRARRAYATGRTPTARTSTTPATGTHRELLSLLGRSLTT